MDDNIMFGGEQVLGQWFSIGSSRYIDLIKTRLERKFSGRDDFRLELKETPVGKYTFLACYLVEHDGSDCDSRDVREIFIRSVVEIISDIILSKWENLLLREIITENYYYFDRDERETIFKYALRHVGRSEEETNASFLPRKEKIVKKLMEFFCHHNKIIIDGFIRFRLKDYLEELNQAADRAVDDFLMDKEYREFIGLLRYFVEVQEPRFELVHVVSLPDGTFKLYDERRQVIDNRYLLDFIVNLVGDSISYEDLLLSALISIAPRQIVLHLGLEKRLEAILEMFEMVFIDRVKVCRGCDFCGTD